MKPTKNLAGLIGFVTNFRLIVGLLEGIIPSQVPLRRECSLPSKRYWVSQDHSVF